METTYTIKPIRSINMFAVTRMMWVRSEFGLVRQFDFLKAFDTKKEARAYIEAVK